MHAIYALAGGVVIALIGLLVKDLRFLYDYAWFVGFAVAFFGYLILMGREAMKQKQAQRK